MPIISALSSASRGLGFAALTASELDGDFELISTSEPLTAGSVTTVSFTSIDSVYDDLEIRIVARGGNTTGSNILLRFNSDTGNNYRQSVLYTVAGGATQASSFSSASSGIEAIVSQMVTSDATSGIYQSALIRIPNYKNTVRHKTIDSLNTTLYSTTSGSTCWTQGVWDNTAAITSIQLTVSGGAIYGDGTRISLYGYKGT